MPQPRQPFLHDLVCLLAAPTQVWSAGDGQVGAWPAAASVQGVLHSDVRVLSRIEASVDGRAGEHLSTETGDGSATFVSLLRHVGADLAAGPDPQVRLDRVRRVAPGSASEQLSLSSQLSVAVEVELTVVFASDLMSIELFRAGQPSVPRAFPAAAGGQVEWGDGELSVRLTCPEATLTPTTDATALTATWRLLVPARGTVSRGWQLVTEDRGAVVTAAATTPLRATTTSSDHRLQPWLDQSLADLDALTMATPDQPEDRFLAAGAPWYFTLFGRDSLWAARLLLPIDLGLARGTLWTLARRQGTTVDPETAEQPGKILHELRRTAFALGEMSLPPLYYGTIDATPLWICLLHDAWRAGLPDPEVTALLPHLERALVWLTDFSDADGDGFCDYLDTTGHGLSNQGWKDSGDSIRFADGTLADGPVALCEVQGYAYEAAVSGAALLDAFARPGAERYRRWAAELADRFRTSFWCGTGDERYPALALDGAKRRVDALSSNIGHLLGTGLLDAEEERLVAMRVSGPALDSGLGLRTMASTDAGHAPLSYHCGSVWPHDTAIVIAGLVKAGLVDHAGGLIEGLLRASVAFDGRLPELWSGEGRPVPYPAACRPQAWSAAAAVVVAQVLG